MVLVRSKIIQRLEVNELLSSKESSLPLLVDPWHTLQRRERNEGGFMKTVLLSLATLLILSGASQNPNCPDDYGNPIPCEMED